jgi:hypothetical protein
VLQNDVAEVLLVTPRGLSFLGDEPLPAAASASLLTLLYASTQPKKHSSFINTNMRCFALQQVRQGEWVGGIQPGTAVDLIGQLLEWTIS